MLEIIDERLDIQMPADNKNSGQTLSQMIAERAAPVTDVAYWGMTTGIQAKAEGVVEPYKPALFDEVPEGMKDPEGNWFAIHSGSIGIFVNVEALGGVPVPRCHEDLLKPEYQGMVGYLDPASAFVGYASAVAINNGLGGSLDDFGPGIEFLRKLAENDPIVPMQTSYARVVSGEIPIMLDYDFNAYRAKYEEDSEIAFVIPCEGSIEVPYVMSLAKDAPHPEAGKKVLDFVLSDEGQQVWANAYLRPARPVELPEEIAARFLPASDYERVSPVDYAAMAEAQARFGERYLADVK